MDFRDFLRILRRSWALIVGVVAVALIVGSVFTLLQRPTYSASATSYVTTGSNSTVNDLSQGATFLQQQVKTYAGVATSTYVLTNVIKQEHLATSVAALQQHVSVQVPVDTVLLQVTATASTPDAAAEIANSVTSNLSTAVQRLTPQTIGATPAVLLTQIEPATAPSTPSSPNPPLDLGIALVLGLLLGVGLAVLRQRLDTRVRDADDARTVVDAPVLGEIFDDSRSAGGPLVVVDGESGLAEAYRALRTNLEFLSFDRRSNSLVVTSSVPQEGKSITLANLAIVIAEAGRKVVVVDADLRRPQLGQYLGLDDSVGLTDVLIGAVPLDAALQQWRQGGPVLLPAGRIPPNPSELLQSDAMQRLISTLEQRFDLVLIDTPPVVAVTDAAILTRRTNGALLVAAAGRTRRTDLRRAAQTLTQIDGRILGLVLTMVPVRRSARYGYERSRPVELFSPRTAETDDVSVPT